MPVTTVLHVLEAAGHGTGRHLVDLVTHADGVAHEVVLPVAPTSRGEDDTSATARDLRAAGVVVHLVPMRRNPLHPDLPRAVLATRRLAARPHVDVIHGHATVGGVVARLTGRLTGRPVVVTPNGVHPSRVVRAVERALAPATTRLVAVSRSEATLVEATGICPPERVVVIPNGIDLAAPEPTGRDLRAELGLPPDARVLGWVGRLAHQKAPELVAEALGHLPPDHHAILVGGGPDGEFVTTRASTRGVADRVHLLGHVPGAAALLNQFDVLVLPSRWEGAPYVPLEAFRARVPVVATDVVGTRDVVLDGQTGWLVPPDDPAALARASRAVLADAAESQRRCDRAHALLVERHDVDRMARDTERVYAWLPPVRSSSR